MNILIIEPLGSNGGMGIYDCGICFGLHKSNNKVALITSCPFPSELISSQIDVFEFFSKAFNKRLSNFRRSIFYLIGLLRTFFYISKNNPTCVYAHFYDYSLKEVALLFFLKITNKQCILNIHDANSLAGKNITGSKNLFKKIADGSNFEITTHSIHSSKILNKTFENNIINIMPHSDIDIFFEMSKYSKDIYQLDSDKEKILFFGQIKKSKGVDILLDAWTSLSELHSKFQLLIVGAVWGADQDNLSNRIKKINDLSPNSVRWINERIPDEHVQYFFQESIVVVLPYLEIYSSGVLLRALGYGKPVIVSNLPAFLEVVDSNNSFIFKSGSSFSLENVIRESLLNPRLREQKKVSAKKLVENQLSWNATGTKMSELINSIIAK